MGRKERGWVESYLGDVGKGRECLVALEFEDERVGFSGHGGWMGWEMKFIVSFFGYPIPTAPKHLIPSHPSIYHHLTAPVGGVAVRAQQQWDMVMLGCTVQTISYLPSLCLTIQQAPTLCN